MPPHQPATTKATSSTATVICRLCGERPVPPGNLRARVYRCVKCHTQRNQAAHAKYRKSEKNRVVQLRYARSAKGRTKRLRVTQRRVYAGDRTLLARTPEEAQAIRAYIRRRIHEFKQGQQTRAKAESRALGAVSAEAAVGGD